MKQRQTVEIGMVTAWILLAVLVCHAGSDGRIQISQADFLSPPLTITNSGSYLFTSPVVITSKTQNAINIMADYVSIDLNGFALQGPGTNSGSGIVQSPLYQGAEVRNGFITGFADTNNHAGLALLGEAFTVEKVMISDCYFGMYLGRNGSVRHCGVFDAATGFRATEGVLFSECVASKNDLMGFLISENCTLMGCNAFNNFYGIYAFPGPVRIQYCVAVSNKSYGIFCENDASVESSLVYGNGGDGIRVLTNGLVLTSLAVSNQTGIVLDHRSTARKCLTANNSNPGIWVADGGLIEDSVARDNAYGFKLRGYSEARGGVVSGHDGFLAAHGISIEGEGQRVDGNHAVANEYGIYTYWGTNLVIRNSAIRNAGYEYALVPETIEGHITNTLSAPYPFGNFQD